MKYHLLAFACLLNLSMLFSQTHSHVGAQPFVFPNIEGYVTIKTDLHMHSVFSDGEVWPTIRVSEALRENLDAISLTEHLEYQPHKEDIPHPDRNRAYHLALEEAKDHDLIIVPGSEITRSEPIGHSNAVFITDANALNTTEAANAFSNAKQQGAFVFWNHPAWSSQSKTGNPILSDFQKELIKKGELHGIEVINTFDYAEESLEIALENNLTIMGTSDIHGLIDWDYTEKGNQRPITLVFAKEKSMESLKEALFDHRTVAVYNSLFVGRQEFLNPLLKACVKINSSNYIDDTHILAIEIENTSSSDLLLENVTGFTFYSSPAIFTLKAGEKLTLQLKTLEKLDQTTLKLKALGAYMAPKEHPIIEWDIKP